MKNNLIFKFKVKIVKLFLKKCVMNLMIHNKKLIIVKIIFKFYKIKKSIVKNLNYIKSKVYKKAKFFLYNKSKKKIVNIPFKKKVSNNCRV
jgi:hypothetical protein